MRKSTIIFATAGILTLLCVGIAGAYLVRSVAAARKNSNATASTKIAAPANGAAPVTIRFVKQPALAPPFLINDLNGEPISSAGYQGKVVLLSFWATWCPPCREEIPELIALQEKYKDRLQIIGISMDDNDTAQEVQKVGDFAKKMGFNYPVAMASKELLDEYGGVPALPTTFVLDTNGRVVQKHAGLYPTNVYESEVRSLLGLPVNATIEKFDDTGQVFLTNASHATELPDVDMSKLTPDQKREALKRMNSESCTCGCGLTVAECRMNDSSCDVSKGLAAKIVQEVAASSPATQKAIQH